MRFCSSEHSALRITHGRCDAVQDQPLRASGAALHVSAGTLPWRGCTPRPGTLIVYAPMHSASMPNPSYTLCAGPSQRADRESEVRIMFTGREGSCCGKVAPAERCIEGPDVGTCANSLANASPRGMQLVRLLPLPSQTPLDQRRPLCQSLTQPSGVVHPEGRSCGMLACERQARRWKGITDSFPTHYLPSSGDAQEARGPPVLDSRTPSAYLGRMP